MIGSTIGHYQIVAKLGAGGMGEVFLAEDARLERKAAIKFLPPELANDPERRQRFLLEAKAASALNHPHVCVVYDVGETEDGRLYIAMEFVEGDSLEALLRRGSVEITRIVEIAIQIADALDAAHARRIVHRDIKPANISLQPGGWVKVLDFGLAKRLPLGCAEHVEVTADFQRTQIGQVLGTPNYMSPEQAMGKAVDHRTDIFSLGTVLYELTTGQLPFRGSGIGEIVNNIVRAQPQSMARFNYDVPPELERITFKCLQKAPDRRYQSARELMVDLKNLARDLDLGVPSPGVTPVGLRVSQFSATVSAIAEPVSLESLKSSDILLNYAAIDDQPLFEGKPGWVSQLHRNLVLRVEQLSGEKIGIARLPESSVSTVVEARVLEHLPHVKAMISVVSPPFVKSDVCRSEVEQFWQIAERTGGQWVENRARLLKVLKTTVSAQEMPPSLADIFSPLLGFEFFELDPQTGRVREFDETFGPAFRQRFFERVYDLAHDLCQILRTLRQIGVAKGPASDSATEKHWVYLATTTSDVQDERDRIKRELLERGHVVLPDAPLPLLARDVESAVQSCLEKCSIAVHLLGRHFGVTPEDSLESIPALQLRLSAMQSESQDLQRLVWMPGQGETVDQRQREFVRRVQEDPALHRNAEIIEGNLNLLKKDLIRRLKPPEEKPPPARRAASRAAPKIYLICDSRDESAVEALEDYLFEQGLEVSLPAFDGSDADAESLHRENLLTCDAVLVYYGAAPKAWVDIKLRELLKAAGFGREQPIRSQAVYVAPPDDHRKERFRSHQATVIRQSQVFAPCLELEAFIDSVKKACA
ncbi:MAG: protein kinase domain-containing protein [Thermoguttaceae bacterium]